jgi:hypothetical protein
MDAPPATRSLIHLRVSQLGFKMARTTRFELHANAERFTTIFEYAGAPRLLPPDMDRCTAAMFILANDASTDLMVTYVDAQLHMTPIGHIQNLDVVLTPDTRDVKIRLVRANGVGLSDALMEEIATLGGIEFMVDEIGETPEEPA